MDDTRGKPILVLPEYQDFAKDYEARRPTLVWTTLVADLLTPVAAILKLSTASARMNFLFESVEGGAVRGRYSVIGCKPDLIWRCRGDVAEINRTALADPHLFLTEDLPPLDSLRRLLDQSKVAIPPELPPMASGLFGYLGYGMIGQIEHLPDRNPDLLGVPDAIMLRPTVIAIFDTVQDMVTIVTAVWPADGSTPEPAEAAWRRAQTRLEETVAELARELPNAAPPSPSSFFPQARPNRTLEQYLALVERAKEYIRAGDIFQVVPSQRFRLSFDLPALSFYRALRRLNPSPFLFYLDFGDFHVVGSSPEILVRLRDGIVTIRPIAGTRKRGATPAEDQALADDLLHDPKELAEHLMLLDLARNDVGRVAETGSVQVTQQMTLERYSHVMHIVSNVEGRLDARYDALDALMAGFPAGTVSGAPKVRAMEIIDELEIERRNVYGGAIGYFGGSGDMDTCIALRTAVLKNGELILQSGGGVVADSVAEDEYQETINKARALVRAAEEAYRFAAKN